MEKKHNKVFVIGVDGMDPKTTRRMVNEGKLPNIKKLIELGSAREDLMLLGANPTITPPMWTTMATGAYPMTHGITCYWNQNLTDLSRFEFAFDSRQCVAEQVWNCIAEAGKRYWYGLGLLAGHHLLQMIICMLLATLVHPCRTVAVVT